MRAMQITELTGPATALTAADIAGAEPPRTC